MEHAPKKFEHIDVGYAEAQRQRQLEQEAMRMVRGEATKPHSPRPPRGMHFVVPPTVLQSKDGRPQVVGYIQPKIKGKSYNKPRGTNVEEG